MQLLSFALPLALAGGALANPLDLFRRDCADSCCAAITGSKAVGDAGIRSAHCSSFLATTVTPPAITTTTTLTGTSPTTTQTGAAGWKRDVTYCPNTVPIYATACSDTVAYSSACSCFGFSVDSTTTVAPTTTTQTVYVVPTDGASTCAASTTTVYKLPRTTFTCAPSTATVTQSSCSIVSGTTCAPSTATITQSSCSIVSGTTCAPASTVTIGGYSGGSSGSFISSGFSFTGSCSATTETVTASIVSGTVCAPASTVTISPSSGGQTGSGIFFSGSCSATTETTVSTVTVSSSFAGQTGSGIFYSGSCSATTETSTETTVSTVTVSPSLAGTGSGIFYSGSCSATTETTTTTVGTNNTATVTVTATFTPVVNASTITLAASTITLPASTVTLNATTATLNATTVTLTTTASAPTDTTCMTDDDATTLVNDFIYFLENPSTDPTSEFATLVETVLTSNFTDTSDSINFMTQGTADAIPMGGVTFGSQTAFLYGQGAQPAIPSVVTQNIWHDCHTLTWRWRAYFNSTDIPVTGINVMDITADKQIDVNYSEFDNGAWLYNLGNPQCQSSSCSTTNSTAKRDLESHSKLRLRLH